MYGISVVGDETEFTLRGDFDLTNTPQLAAVLKNYESDRIVLDLRGVNYIDSAFLTALVRHVQAARKQGGDLALRVPAHSHISRVLDIAKLGTVIDLRYEG